MRRLRQTKNEVSVPLMVLYVSIIVVSLLVLTYVRHKVYWMGKDIGNLWQDQKKLEEKNRQLRLQISELQKPERLEKLASRMGLAKPRSEQIIVMKSVIAKAGESND